MTGEGTVAVVGAGPCGVAAAIQLRRSGVRTVLFERRQVGGLLHNANLVENYPGLVRGIRGPVLCRLLERHLKAAGIIPVFEEVKEIARGQDGYRLRGARAEGWTAGAVILATGTRPETGILPGTEDLEGRLVFYEIRDALERAPRRPGADRRAAILGGGDAAYDYALNLAGRGFTVRILQRSPPRCLALLEERARERQAIYIDEGVAVRGCAPLEHGIEVRLARRGEKQVVQADFLLIACGRDPDDGLAASLRDPHGKLPPGVFTGGDLVRGPFRQAGISVGDGLAAAMSAARYIASRRAEMDRGSAES